MKLFDKIKLSTSKVETANGDIAYGTTLNYCVDLYGIINAARYNPVGTEELFIKAYNQDPRLALKILMYSRDVRTGAGERTVFRRLFKYLCINHENVAKQLMPFIVEIGRWDDVFVALNTNVEETVINLIKIQLEQDLKTLEENNTVSLLGKWMPSINTSNFNTVKRGRYLAKKLGMREAEYRKMLSKLRKGKIVENNLREKDYTFDYENVPSLAMHKYRNAFLRNDEERYAKYLEDVANGEKKINTSTLYLCDIVKEFKEYEEMTDKEILAMQVKWDNVPRNLDMGNTIVVRDGSGSMTVNYALPLRVANSLAIYFAEQLKGEFKNKFITFSDKPKLVELPEGSLYEKLKYINQFQDYYNTDIRKVYKVLLDAYKNEKEEVIDRVIIVSDMEFDRGVSCKSTFEEFKEDFDKLGVKMPEIVYWNVNAMKIHFATSQEQPNIRFVSGASSKVMDSILRGKSLTQIEFVIEAVKKYTFVDEITL